LLLFVLLYLLLFMNITRQGISMLISMLALLCIRRNKYVWAAAMATLAVSIHSAALFSVPVLVIGRIRWNKNRFRFGLIAVASMTLLIGPILSVFKLLFPFYAGYELSEYTSQGRSSILYVINLVSVIYALHCLRHEMVNDEERQDLFSYSVIAVAAAMLGTVFGREILITRAVAYWQINIMYFVPLVTKFKHRYKLFYFFIVYGLSVSYFCYRILLNVGSIQPYETFLK